MSRAPFLKAQWRHLVMLNYEVERSALVALVPRGTELDEWNGHSYVSVVGFQFLATRVVGLAVPFHRDFEEVNLRFYVRRRVEDGWRRGVVFVRELVPRTAIALVARVFYNEKYSAVPMGHRIEWESGRILSVAYRWRVAGHENGVSLSVASEPDPLVPGSHEEFIAEHYWGYSVRRNGGTFEYSVEHPPWRVAPATRAELDCDVSKVYGDAFVPFLRARPVSAFLADGSEVSVSHGVRLDA